MTTLSTLRSEVYKSIGNRNDTDAQTWADRGVNAGMVAHCLLSEPPEARVSGSMTAVASGDPITITSDLIRPIRLERLYNTTGACFVGLIPLRMWDLYYFPTTGNVKYCALHGNTLYYKPYPSTDEVISVWYFQYPARLVNEDDVYPYQSGEDFTLAFAKKWTWACQEEKEDVDMWSGLASELALPDKLIADLRKYTREEWGYGVDISKALSKGAS